MAWGSASVGRLALPSVGLLASVWVWEEVWVSASGEASASEAQWAWGLAELSGSDQALGAVSARNGQDKQEGPRNRELSG